MNIIVKCTLAACAMLFSGSTLSAGPDCGYFNNQGDIVPMQRRVVERRCCTKPQPCPKPYCPPPRVICYSCPSCPEYAAYWEKQDAVLGNHVNNVRGAPAPTEVDKWERTGFNDNGRTMYNEDQAADRSNTNDGRINDYNNMQR